MAGSSRQGWFINHRDRLVTDPLHRLDRSAHRSVALPKCAAISPASPSSDVCIVESFGTQLLKSHPKSEFGAERIAVSQQQIAESLKGADSLPDQYVPLDRS